MGRAERMTPKCSEQLPNRSIVWYSVGDGFDSHKAVASLAVGAELAAQIHLGLLGVLLLVQPVFVCLPDIEQSTGNGCPSGGKHAPRHDHRLAPTIFADGSPHGQLCCAFPVERAEDRALGCPTRQAMIDGIDQHRDPGNVGEQDELLAPLIAHVTSSGQELNPQCPFFLGELNLAHKGVNVGDEAGHYLLQPGIGCVYHAVQHILSNLLLAIVAHALSLPWSMQAFLTMFLSYNSGHESSRSHRSSASFI